MASVIFCVFLTLEMRSRVSLSEATTCAGQAFVPAPAQSSFKKAEIMRPSLIDLSFVGKEYRSMQPKYCVLHSTPSSSDKAHDKLHECLSRNHHLQVLPLGWSRSLASGESDISKSLAAKHGGVLALTEHGC